MSPRNITLFIFPSPAAIGLIIYEVEGYKYVKKRKIIVDYLQIRLVLALPGKPEIVPP
jgi:hypothetical protein